jgi:hypothetical protein
MGIISIYFLKIYSPGFKTYLKMFWEHDQINLEYKQKKQNNKNNQCNKMINYFTTPLPDYLAINNANRYIQEHIEKSEHFN